MKFPKALLPITALCTVALVSAVSIAGQDPGKGGKAVDAGMPKPTITAEHGMLKKLVGTWDANVTCNGPEGPMNSKGTATYKAIGDTWVASDFTGKMMGMPFTGHGVEGFDPSKKKFISTWCDSMSTALMVMEGTHDASTNSTTLTGECPDPMTGKMVKHRMVTKMGDANSMTFHMYAPGPDGKEAEMMTIEYKRRK